MPDKRSGLTAPFLSFLLNMHVRIGILKNRDRKVVLLIFKTKEVTGRGRGTFKEFGSVDGPLFALALNRE